MFACDIGGGAQGEVTETKTELGIQAGKAAALTVGEAMVAPGWFEIGFDRSWN